MPETVTAYSAAAHNKYRVSFVRLVIRALGVSFLCIVSLGLAFYAFVFLPQIQDLFFDVRYYVYQGLIYWAGFYIIAIAFWAIPLAFCARLLLMQNFDVIGVDTADRYNRIVVALPKIYVTLAFLIVLGGIYQAASDLPTPTPDDELQVRLSTYLSTHIIILFGVTALVAVLLFVRSFIIGRYDLFAARLEKRRPERFHAILANFERLSRKHQTGPAKLSFYLDELKPDFLDRDTFIAHQRTKVAMILYLKGIMLLTVLLIILHFITYSQWLSAMLDIDGMQNWPQFLKTLTQTASDTLWLKRAAFLPILFGAWLPFAAFLALLSNRNQFPYLGALIGGLIAISFFIGDGHDVRILRLTTPEQAPKQPQLKFNTAVEQWKKANGWYEKGCDRAAVPPAAAPGTAGGPNCPRPIIVAAEGGGSRAAFLTASVLGILQDTSLDAREAQRRKLRPFGNQLFGVSSVSGGSVGTAMFLAALREHPERPEAELELALYRQRLWFRNIAEPSRNFLHGFVTYKDALQATLSNDFLSPVLIAYLARDLTTVSRLPMVMDRAGVLETSWETSFDSVYGKPDTPPALQAPRRTMSPRAGGWSPVPVFNTTSIDTGRRGLISPLSATERLSDGKFVFTDSYDINQLFCSKQRWANLGWKDRISSYIPRLFSQVTNTPCTRKKPDAIDVRISTAAGVSARSPIVSPHANIRDRNGQVADSWADGGYFDNSGAVTAYEMAVALKRADSRLEPYVVQISSEPQWFIDNCQSRLETKHSIRMRPQQVAKEEAAPLPNEADFSMLGTWGDVSAINSTRVARSYETMVALGNQIEALNNKKASYSLIYVCPQQRENIIYNSVLRLLGDKAAALTKHGHKSWKNVSLSWWLSPGLQAYLDRQLYAPYNKQELDSIVELLRE